MEQYLYHHGILGQRWGVRRYQNKDGSLTAAGKKRAENLASEYKALTKKNVQFAPKKEKTVKEMTDKEIQSKISRLQSEKTLLSLQRDMNNLQPKQTSLGKAFVTSVGKDVLKPVAIQASKNFLSSLLDKETKKVLGLDKKDDNAIDDKKVKQLEREFKALNYEKLISNLKAEKKK